MKHFLAISFSTLLIFSMPFCGNEKKQGNESKDTPQGFSWKANDGGVEYVSYNGKPVNCPVMGGQGRRDMFTDYKEKRYFFCCNGCGKGFAATPDKYIKEGAIGVPLSKLTAEDKKMVSKNS